MNKRQFLLSASATIGVASQTTSTAKAGSEKSVERDGVVFKWHHQDGRLFGELSAPTDGWIAVGFNAEKSLRGTYFVMAAVSTASFHAEEHIAIVPQHKRIAELGWSETLVRLSSSYTNGRSQISFSIAANPDLQHGIALWQGAQTHMMLAWSHESDFNHHSAWRQHFDVTL